MTPKFGPTRRVLAIAPKSRGFGFVVMESQTSPIDWGVRTGRGNPVEKQIATLTKVRDLLEQYQPGLVILEQVDRRSRRGGRIRLLLESIHNVAVWENVKVRRISINWVRRVFWTFNAWTKHDIATVIIHHLPEFAPKMPPPRKPWMAEDHSMAIFDAAALALAFFYTRLGASRLAKNGVSPSEQSDGHNLALSTQAPDGKPNIRHEKRDNA